MWLKELGPDASRLWTYLISSFRSLSKFFYNTLRMLFKKSICWFNKLKIKLIRLIRQWFAIHIEFLNGPRFNFIHFLFYFFSSEGNFSLIFFSLIFSPEEEHCSSFFFCISHLCIRFFVLGSIKKLL